MRASEVLRGQAESAYRELSEAIAGVEEPHSWAVLPNLGSDYLHSDATIHGITLHVATCKLIYGSLAFRDSEIRWRDCETRVAAIEPSWEKAVSVSA